MVRTVLTRYSPEITNLLIKQVARMELAECGAFRDDVTVPRVPLRSTRATQLINPSIANNDEITKPQLLDLKNMTKQFDVIIEKDSEGNFVASVPALRGCHTQAKSLDVLMERIREAIELCLEVQGETTEPLDFVGVQRISVAA